MMEVMVTIMLAETRYLKIVSCGPPIPKSVLAEDDNVRGTAYI